MGTKFTILIFAAIIILIGVAGLAPRRFFVIIPLLGVPFGTLTASLKPADGLIVEIESPYQYIQVIEREGSRYLIYNEGGGVQSKYRSETVFSDGSYFDVAALLPALTDGKRVLIVGLAGGTVSRAMQALYGDETGFHIDGVEIDPVVVRLAEQYFELDQPDLTIRSGDGRQVVALGKEKYDVLFVDAYSNQLYIPFHLTTKEFFMDARERLAPGGVLAINVNAFTEESELLRIITNTIASVFPEVARFSVGRTSYIIFASEAPIQFERLVGRDFFEPAFGEFAITIANGIDPIEFNSGERILTDDLAPIEHLTDKMFWEYFVQLIRNEKGR